jgi:hypothetical protein
MKFKKLCALCVLALSVASFGYAQKDDMKDAADSTGKAVKKTGKKIKKGTKKAANKTAEKTAEGADKVKSKTE